MSDGLALVPIVPPNVPLATKGAYFYLLQMNWLPASPGRMANLNGVLNSTVYGSIALTSIRLSPNFVRSANEHGQRGSFFSGGRVLSNRRSFQVNSTSSAVSGV